MNLKGEVVKHEKFGIGTIIESQEDYIMVLFNETKEEKKFLYPEAIGVFLELQNKSSSANETKTEQRRLDDVKKIIKRHKNIKKIIGIRQENEKK